MKCNKLKRAVIRYASDVPNIFHDIFPITKTDSTNILKTQYTWNGCFKVVWRNVSFTGSRLRLQ